MAEKDVSVYKSGLPVNLDNLIHRRIIENDRVEFKATWDEHIKQSMVRTVCAFANDLLNNNGGYIILGIEEQEGKPLLPPRGMEWFDVDRIQREIIGACKGNVSPEFLPHVYVEQYQAKTILVIWAPAGENRPYEAPLRKGKGKTYWIRSAGATVEAVGDLHRQLMEQAAKIPFDDRRSLTGKVKDISWPLVKQFLQDVRSHLASMEFTTEEVYDKLELVVPVNDHKIPRNAALLFFNDDPEQFFRGVRIEVVQFGGDADGDLIEERIFKGSLPQQVRSCLNYIQGIAGVMLQKIPEQAEVERTVPYPYGAVEEAIVNAVYHRSYEYPPEPIKVYLYSDRMEITSYPGPVPGIRLEHFQSGLTPAVPARNRRIGEMLKDLKLAEARGTGIRKIQRKMEENGSPKAEFDFDEDRTYFRVTLPIHPRYPIIHTAREVGHLRATGNLAEAVALLEHTFKKYPDSGIIASLLIGYASEMDNHQLAHQIMTRFEQQPKQNDAPRPYIAMTKTLLDRNKVKEAEETLKRMPPAQKNGDISEITLLKKRITEAKYES
jgi:ATP-dependent DNA helicase RecG